jgi:hypothetical protein
MKLLSTLRYGSLQDTVAGTGNHGGDLRLFFSILNPADSQPASPPPSVWWQGQGHGAVDTYKLPGGSVIALNLNIVGDVPNRLYVFGSIQVTTANSVVYGPAIGQSAGLFGPGQPAVGILQGRGQGQSAGVQFDVGFDLAVPWDGTSADCTGTWWAVWH